MTSNLSFLSLKFLSQSHKHSLYHLPVSHTVHCYVCLSIQQLPIIGLTNITTFLELSQLGFQAAEQNQLFLHGAKEVSVFMLLKN